MLKPLTPRYELLARIVSAGTQARAAKDLGITPQYLNDLLKGRRIFSRRMLAKLGLETVIVKKGAS